MMPIRREKNKLLIAVLFMVIVNVGWSIETNNQNLIENSDFENKSTTTIPSKWTIIDCKYSGSIALVSLEDKESSHGNKSICLENKGKKGIIVVKNIQKIAVKTGEQYSLTAYIKVNKGSAYVIVQTFKKVGFGKAFMTRIVSGTSPEWVECKKKFKIPEGISVMVVRLVAAGEGAKAWFDNISLVKTKNP